MSGYDPFTNNQFQVYNGTYVCGHCGTTVNGIVISHVRITSRWLVCPHCGMGSVANDSIILPPPQTFSDVGGLPDDICGLYDEARSSFGAQAYTGCEMLCRKILMNAAVNKGAKQNMRFVQYVEYLNSNYCVTPALKDMATTIKDNGNEATHEINSSDQERAEYTLKFTWHILTSMYGVEHDFKKYQSR